MALSDVIILTGSTLPTYLTPIMQQAYCTSNQQAYCNKTNNAPYQDSETTRLFHITIGYTNARY